MTNIHQVHTKQIELQDLFRLNHFTYRALSSDVTFPLKEPVSIPWFFNKETFYDKDPWKYQINKYGFRGKDWNFKKSPAFFGCSCTFGIGVETPASDIVAKTLNYECVPNLGLPAGSILNIIKLFAAFTKHHSISHAFITIPPISRVFLPAVFNKEWAFENYLPHFIGHDKKKHKKVISVITEDVSMAYACDYIEWANLIAKDKKIKLHWGAWEPHTYDFLESLKLKPYFWSNPDKARDAAHPGIKSHEKLAKLCCEKIGNV